MNSFFINTTKYITNKLTITGLVSVAIVQSLTLFSAATHAAPPPSTVSVVTHEVNSHSLSQSLSLIGKLEAKQDVIIAPEVSGKIDEIAVKENQKVTKGQLLVKLNDDKALAEVNEAKAYLKDEKRKLTEYQRLVKRGAATQTSVDTQAASVDIAQARLQLAQAQLSDLHIKAPFDGTIGFINFSLGKIVSSSYDLMTLDNLETMQLDLQVPERYLSQVSEGMGIQATSRAWSDDIFNGKVVGIDSRVNAETLNIPIRIDIPNTDNKLKPGMLMSAHLTFPELSAAIIPVQAIEYEGTKRFVYRIDSENVAHRLQVQLGARIKNQVVVESGIDIGDIIVVQGIVNLSDETKVKVLYQEKTDKAVIEDKSTEEALDERPKTQPIENRTVNAQDKSSESAMTNMKKSTTTHSAEG